MSLSAAGGSSRYASSVSGVRTSGTTARRDCLVDASATRRHRSTRVSRTARDRHLRPLRDERLHGDDSQHHRVADHLVHLVALEDRLAERDGDGGFGRRLDARHELHPHVAPHGAGDTREKLVASSVEHRDGVADAQPQDARQVLRFLARQRNGLVAGIERGRKEPMHAVIIREDRTLATSCLCGT